MSLEVQINEALKEAMKAQDEARKRAIRAIKSQILLLKTDGTGTEVTDERILKAMQTMVKQREESLAVYTSQNREDLAQIEREEIEVIRGFMPKQFTAEELDAELKVIIAELGVTSAKEMGKVIGAAGKKFQGKADGKAIAEAVKRLLA